MDKDSQQPSAPAVYFSLDKDGMTGGLQLAIEDDKGGYRIAGPKYSGTGRNLERYRITANDAMEIRRYLDAAFPPGSGF